MKAVLVKSLDFNNSDWLLNVLNSSLAKKANLFVSLIGYLKYLKVYRA